MRGGKENSIPGYNQPGRAYGRGSVDGTREYIQLQGALVGGGGVVAAHLRPAIPRAPAADLRTGALADEIPHGDEATDPGQDEKDRVRESGQHEAADPP